jgi:MoaA/NifB/PqqE/SkfB family radical SAM enzyme
MKLKNLIGIGNKVLMNNVFNKNYPLNVMISLTNKCQSRCKYCNIPLRKQKELTTKELFKLFDELKKNGTERIGLWGGEPLIREDIGDIINYAKNKGFYVTMDSNGYLASEKIKDIKKLDLLLLSLDGNELCHDKNREKGSYKKVIQALEVCKNTVPVWTITVLTKNNLDQIDYILNLARKYKFYCTFQILHHSKSISSNDNNLLPTREEYLKVIDKLIFEKKRNAPIVSSFRYLNTLKKWDDYSKSYRVNRKKKDISCYAGKLFCNVDTNGDVYPCVVLIEQMKALNYLDVGFKRAFDNISNVKCSACTASCLIEFNLLFSFHLDVIYNWMRYTSK